MFFKMYLLKNTMKVSNLMEWAENVVCGVGYCYVEREREKEKREREIDR